MVRFPRNDRLQEDVGTDCWLHFQESVVEVTDSLDGVYPYSLGGAFGKMSCEEYLRGSD